MNKRELAAAVSQRTGRSVRASEEMIDAVFSVIGEQIASGQNVKISGFGRFDMQFRAARIGRNPKTKEAVEIPGRFVPRFTPAKALSETTSFTIKVQRGCCRDEV